MDLWDKIDKIKGQMVVGNTGAPVLPTGSHGTYGAPLTLKVHMIGGGGSGGTYSTGKSCNHKWVEVGFTFTKTVCYHCDVEKP